MSINIKSKVSPYIKLKMIDEQERIIGKVKDKVQVIVSLPDMEEFTVDLLVSMTIFSDDVECFIITSSKEEIIEKTIKKYDLEKSSISTDYKSFMKTFDKQINAQRLKKSLMIIDKDCKIAYRDIL